MATQTCVSVLELGNRIIHSPAKQRPHAVFVVSMSGSFRNGCLDNVAIVSQDWAVGHVSSGSNFLGAAIATQLATSLTRYSHFGALQYEQGLRLARITFCY